jgi:hypothetical protein
MKYKRNPKQTKGEKEMKKTGNGDERDGGFGAPEHVVQHKPGFDLSSAKHETEDGKDHRRRPKEAKDIPQTPLAQRLRRTQKGEK